MVKEIWLTGVHFYGYIAKTLVCPKEAVMIDLSSRQKVTLALAQGGTAMIAEDGTAFRLTSGGCGTTFFDVKEAVSDPKVLKEIVKAILPYTEGCGAVAGMELGGVPIAVAVSLAAEIPFLLIRKAKKLTGRCNQVEGKASENCKVLLVEDVTTKGYSSLKAAKILEEDKRKFVVDRVVTVCDREEGAYGLLRVNNLDLVQLTLASEVKVAADKLDSWSIISGGVSL